MVLASLIRELDQRSPHTAKLDTEFCIDDVVHLWRIELDCAVSDILKITDTLSADERERAARFRSATIANRWAVARGALRLILARYCGTRPESVIFQTDSKGKPSLASPANGLSFNLSHSDGVALVAITRNRRIGVDIEALRPLPEVAELSRRFLAPGECSYILTLPPQNQAAAFFTCWTRKEAFLKAVGVGLSAGLDRLEVSLQPDQPARLISGGSTDPAYWNLIDVSSSATAAAIAVEGLVRTLERFSFEYLESELTRDYCFT